jgi:hypothetical protein
MSHPATPAARFAATHLAPQADQLAAALTLPRLPHGLPAGARITLLADYERALDAVEIACGIADGTISWEADYSHLSYEEDPQAAAEAAIDEAQDAIADYHAALTCARAARTPALAA